MTINERLKNIMIQHNHQISEAQISSETNIIEDLGMDSLQWMLIIIEVETEFGIQLDDELMLMEDLTVVGKLEKVIERLLSK